MCGALTHRGPDDEGYLVRPGRVGLGFRRLSIIDLATGNQPLWDERRTVAVTCNGEIYNFQELRRGLEQRGHSFRTGSDVETIAHLYEERGDACLEELRGMFGIALWDDERDRLVLARDRLGVKPLYWARVDGGILYASEPRAILASGLLPARPDPEAIGEYLTLQYVPPPRSGFLGISKLAPGEMLVFEDGQPRVRRGGAPAVSGPRGGGVVGVGGGGRRGGGGGGPPPGGARATPRGRGGPAPPPGGGVPGPTRLRMTAAVPAGAFLWAGSTRASS